jgi:hypothetical protein
MITAEAVVRRARELLSDEVFKLILNDLKNRTIKDWASTDPSAQTKREEHWRDLQAIGRLETHLKAIVDSAKMDERKAAEHDRRASLRKKT